jgi:hypothetical protein
VYPRWLRRISARVTLLEGHTLPLSIVEDAKALAPDARRLLAHVVELRRENLRLRGARHA